MSTARSSTRPCTARLRRCTALQVCPYIGSRYSGRVDTALLKQGKWPPQMRALVEDTMLPEQPPFFVLARAASAAMRADPGQPPHFHRAALGWPSNSGATGVQMSDAEARSLLTTSERWPWTPADLILYWQVAA